MFFLLVGVPTQIKIISDFFIELATSDENFNLFCDAPEGPTYQEHSGGILSMEQTGLEMGNYSIQYCMDPETFAPRATSVGKATVKNVYGKAITIKKTKYITFSTGEALNHYLYLTHSERAGGAPHVFDNFPSSNNRRWVNFGNGDAFNAQWPQNEPVCDDLTNILLSE